MGAELWADVSRLDADETPAALARIRSSSVSAVLARRDQLHCWEPLERIVVACLIDQPDSADLDVQFADLLIASSPSLLDKVRAVSGGKRVGVRCEIADHDGMELAARMCGPADVLVAAFADETNIPLELLLARAQHTGTRVLKELLNAAESSIVLGVLETGPAGLVVRGDQLAELGQVAAAIRTHGDAQRELVSLEVTRAVPVGMGHRGCVDTATLFGPDEGMIVGSTSSGGILVCAEVHYLPYMNLRPFRVNAGAVHSYVFGAEETAYVTDLRAGERAHAVSSDGRFREVVVGRIKVELRPLRLIEARHGDVTVNVLLQDDWHVRVMSSDGKPLNLTEVRPGAHLLGHVCAPGRHVGIKVSEEISEF
jgi:3-dehydroquinate synthase II/3-amino-4-hydroxybenzoic acid synthase